MPMIVRICFDRIRRGWGLKVFLSYGHDQNAPLVERIRGDLEAAGHQVWIDTSKIKAGEDWRRSIVDGLAETDSVLGFLSKHSVRDLGVCLDELAVALHVKGGTIATIWMEGDASAGLSPACPRPAEDTGAELRHWRKPRLGASQGLAI